MNEILLLLAWLVPLAVLPLAARADGRWWPPLAVLPALAAGILVPVGTLLDLPWLMLGQHLGLDATGRLFLFFSSLVWMFAGWYAAVTQPQEASSARFRVFFLLAMAGNLLLILAADMATFYLGFALMGISAYGLVVHRGSQRARRAGRIYLGWTLVGEVALFSALILVASAANSLRFADIAAIEISPLAVGLLLFGFGIKLALPGVHVWLPLAYPAATAPGAAVLSGPMINAGLLGWLRFLPPGATELAGWGDLLTSLGALGIGLGVLVGLTQRDPRAVLAYSSIAKTGLITAVFGVALASPGEARTIVAALVLFAMHHLLVKGALFLGIGEWERGRCSPWVLGGLLGLALTMAGLPFTAGAAAKFGIKEALSGADAELGTLLFFSALGTVMLMLRFIWLVARKGPRVADGRRQGLIVWLLLAVPGFWLPFGFGELAGAQADYFPLFAGLIAGLAVWRFPLGSRIGVAVPPGDILALFPRRISWAPGEGQRLAAQPRPGPDWWLTRSEGESPRLVTMGSLWLFVMLAFLATLMWSG